MKRGLRIFIWCAIIFIVVFIGPMFIGRIYAVLFSWLRMGITPSFGTIFSSGFLTRLYGLGICALLVFCLIYAFYIFKYKITKSNHNSSEPNSRKLRVNCPQCGRVLHGAKREMIGDIGVCPKCKAEFTIKQKGQNPKDVGMLKLSVYNRFSKSPTYFDICKESFKEFEDSYNTLITEFKKYGSELSEDRVNFLSMKMDRDLAISITFAAMCLEAFIYDYAATYFTDTYAKNYLTDIDFVSKWVVIPKLVTGKNFPTDSQAFEQLKKLCKERNDLVHYKSIPLPDRDQRAKMPQKTKEEIKGRKEFNPYQTIVEVLNELSSLDDKIEAKWWELIEINYEE